MSAFFCIAVFRILRSRGLRLLLLEGTIKNPSPNRRGIESYLQRPVGICASRLLHCQHVTSLLDAVRDAALVLGGKSCVLARKNLACLCNKTGKLLHLVESVVHRVEGAV